MTTHSTPALASFWLGHPWETNLPLCILLSCPRPPVLPMSHCPVERIYCIGKQNINKDDKNLLCFSRVLSSTWSQDLGRQPGSPSQLAEVEVSACAPASGSAPALPPAPSSSTRPWVPCERSFQCPTASGSPTVSSGRAEVLLLCWGFLESSPKPSETISMQGKM